MKFCRITYYKIEGRVSSSDIKLNILKFIRGRLFEKKFFVMITSVFLVFVAVVIGTERRLQLRRNNKMLSVILIVVFIVTVGCSNSISSKNVTKNENYVLKYIGESAHWVVNYDITVTGDWKKASLIIKPKDTSMTGEVEYALYINGNKRTRGHEEISTRIGGISGGNGVRPDDTDAYAIQIKWGDNEEIFPLILMNR